MDLKFYRCNHCGQIVAVVKKTGVPIVCCGAFDIQSLGFGGTSLIIVVGVILETLKQVESMMLTRHYKGFLSE